MVCVGSIITNAALLYLMAITNTKSSIIVSIAM